MTLTRLWRQFWHGLRVRHFGTPAPLVAVLRLTGPIGQTGRGTIIFDALARPLERLFDHPGVTAVALAINSPGGAPVQSALILRHIRDLATEHQIPVIAFCEDVAASGGYMLALAGDEIIVHEASLVGSIGVISGGFGFAQALDRLGIERRVYTAGENKVRLDPFQPEKPGDRTWIAGLQDEIHTIFKDIVRERRGDKLTGDPADLFSGDVWTGRRAVALGLADGVGAMMPTLKQRYGPKVRVRPVRWRKTGLLSALTGEASLRTSRHAAAALAALEERLMWQRWGL
ncbi:hypothetical protein CCR85_06855 [Rhodothalassium salexigens]|uniref:S49 family peptidase n=1 Tax=Rhodothalassium salexigens TaxID=1086 RepID=UPI001913956A|nr:S49 family peptidase [Rhodothalassium salexigens]MBK5911211.1 hypothetical protein [Rhodothalassium salexigens]MBK5919900.1 hypothetical protein [Rhodothalassium salexigens]